MKKLYLSLSAFCVAILILPSCSSIFCGTRAKITLESPEITQPVDITTEGEKEGGAETAKAGKISSLSVYSKSKTLKKQENEKKNDGKDSLHRHLTKLSLGLAKWTGIDAPTARFSFRSSYSYLIPIKKLMYLEPSLGISEKGMSYKEEAGSFGNVKISRKDVGEAWYMDLSCLFRVGIPKISVGIGPYLGIGLGGSYVITSKASSTNVTRKPYFGKDGAGRKRVDFGLMYDIRYTIKRFIIGVEMQSGFVPVSGNDSKVKNFGAWISLGYLY